MADTPPALGRQVDHEVTVVGAGAAGLAVAATLLARGHHDVAVLDRGSGVGGVWQEQHYPGAGTDVPPQHYAFSFAPRADEPDAPSSPAADVRAYLARVAREHGIAPHVQVETSVSRAVHDDLSGLWTLHITRPDGSAGRIVTRTLVLATGQLHAPRLPDIPGLGRFTGPVVHPSAWDPLLTMEGLRVGVVGAGPTMLQLLPHVVAQAEEVVVFCRRAPWVLPPVTAPGATRPVDLATRAAGVVSRARLPWVPRALAAAASPAGASASGLRTEREQQARQHLQASLDDPALLLRLVPPDRFGARPVVRSDALALLAAPHVALVDGPPVRVEPHVAVAADGQRHRLDMLVLATGLQPGGAARQLEVVGSGGRRLDETWADGTPSWHGVMVRGYPNLFIVGGPHTTVPGESLLPVLEAQARLVVDLVAERDRRRARSVTVRPEAQERWLDDVARLAEAPAWGEGVRSDLADATGRPTFGWPGTQTDLLRRLATAGPRDVAFLNERQRPAS